jgi:hypothetical protein
MLMLARSRATGVLALSVLLTITSLHAWTQRASKSVAANSDTATHASAELASGKLDSAKSKTGDQVTLNLTQDVKSNGQVVLKKGTRITGVVRNVKQVEGNAATVANSMIEIQWLTPSALGKASRELTIAVQWISQISPMYKGDRADSATEFETVASTTDSSVLPGSVTSAPAALETTSRSNGKSNVALMSMPSVVTADNETTTTLQKMFGISSASNQLFRIGRGEVVAANGSRQSLDIFSHLSNDTLLTSRSKSFEISSGAQLNLLVGVGKN